MTDHKPHHKHVHETAPLHDPVDSWHDHTKDEKPQNAHAEVGNAMFITGIGVALFLVIVAAVVAVYAYYIWFITARLARSEIASGQASPAIEARKYRSESILRLTDGGSVDTPATTEGATPISYTVAPINLKIEQVAQRYTTPGAAPVPAPASAPVSAPAPVPAPAPTPTTPR